MAKKPTRQYVCRACGAVHAKWAGQCDGCGEWNTLEEMPLEPLAASSVTSRVGGGRRVRLEELQGQVQPPPRVRSGIAELDRVLGGGFVPASVVLVGGDPGIGKSTLLLQAASQLAGQGERVLYISGEEAVDQIRLRAQRLGVAQARLELAASINVADIIATLDAEPDVRAVVIDSIQTMWLETVESAPGTVSQVRACAFELIRAAKRRGFSLVLVGHVTKEGALAGPRVLEHMVDAVMYFEGDRGHQFRILRAAKNRYGATDEIGVFAMTDRGLEEVSNPSALFLAERRGNIAGSAVFAGLEGTRPVLLEVQALLAPKGGDGAPRRAVVGWDTGRLAMLLAVLETRCGLKLSGMDVYLNVAGGLKVAEPAADLAVAAALVSAATGVPTNSGEVYFGEVGLSGEIRQVAQADARLKEAAKLGFTQAVLPRRIARGNARTRPPEGLGLRELGHISDLISPEAEAD
ncbi:DNA repair protein RadA [Acetobacter sp. TBRC 12305]|uniref:DNA repair protein RadA n=1 Tax=Acetobacter garciniae TaxID=2817435 RepID=A0A939HJ65_9PROT|nr:DNA repair protein RadA [Acetobacter garciniae]MBO1323715.1 DNA repair protein RadA [Acetobacter garciniae]MBX0343404.1 DNA repair protein RadA [Acetobacter garciniae]